MNRYEFEDKISDYLDNQLSISERRKFESFLGTAKNPTLQPPAPHHLLSPPLIKVPSG